ncbi:hypothetical protein CHUAL_011495 [Chamberlinius hualienensis]
MNQPVFVEEKLKSKALHPTGASISSHLRRRRLVTKGLKMKKMKAECSWVLVGGRGGESKLCMREGLKERFLKLHTCEDEKDGPFKVIPGFHGRSFPKSSKDVENDSWKTYKKETRKKDVYSSYTVTSTFEGTANT